MAESIRAELAGYVKTRTDEILNLSNKVARLKKELEKHEGEAMVQVSFYFYVFVAKLLCLCLLQHQSVCMCCLRSMRGRPWCR